MRVKLVNKINGVVLFGELFNSFDIINSCINVIYDSTQGSFNLNTWDIIFLNPEESKICGDPDMKVRLINNVTGEKLEGTLSGQCHITDEHFRCMLDGEPKNFNLYQWYVESIEEGKEGFIGESNSMRVKLTNVVTGEKIEGTMSGKYRIIDECFECILDDELKVFNTKYWFAEFKKKKEQPKVYKDSTWLTSSDAPSTDSVTAYYGPHFWKQDAKEELTAFLEISDCYSKVRLRQNDEDTPADFLCKMKKLGKTLDKFIEHLDNTLEYTDGDDNGVN